MLKFDFVGSLEKKTEKISPSRLEITIHRVTEANRIATVENTDKFIREICEELLNKNPDGQMTVVDFGGLIVFMVFDPNGELVDKSAALNMFGAEFTIVPKLYAEWVFMVYSRYIAKQYEGLDFDDEH